MANRLINETSPYLLQHAHNPVDWYAWGQEALQKAKEQDKPILLSIGYSACHWCHVMERESFENEATASLMNQNFINIKVDREERPDLDSIYMQAVQALTGQGGWPMTVFLTPNGEPFYGGTYFPPHDRGGMPSFPRVLMSIAEAYKSQRVEVTKATTQLVAHLQQQSDLRSNTGALDPQILDQAFSQLQPSFDEQNGGFGGAPKFPQPMIYDFLLHYHYQKKDPKSLHMIELSLEKMALGGIYDQVGGGFHRYSTDDHWLVPHFEKMLYDNALLSRLYLHAYQYTGRPFHKRIVEETLDYVLREMTDETGGFYSSQDADSEGEEGKFFAWTPQEIEELLGTNDGHIFNSYYNVTDQGNFEGKNILHVPIGIATVASELDLPLERLEEVIQRGKQILLEVRSKRIAPARDDKILTSWNGLMLRSFAEAAAVLQRQDYRKAAIANATFITNNLQENGRVLRTYKDGRAKLKGYLEDYSFLIDGLLSVYELTFDPHWLKAANRLSDDMNQLFWDDVGGTFYDTGQDHESLLIRPRELFDNATPCGTSVAVAVLLRTGLLMGNEEHLRKASQCLVSVGAISSQHPTGMGQWLSALDFHLSQPKEIAIVGTKEDKATKALLDVIHNRYIPNKVVALMEEDDFPGKQELPLLRYRTRIRGQSAAYICKNYICQLPVTDPKNLAHQLDN